MNVGTANTENTQDTNTPHKAFVSDLVGGSEQVYYAWQYTDGDGNWHMDSGATAHITNDFNNLAISADYSGQENLMVGNGNRLPISSIGQNAIPISSASSLLLNNILFVPQITKNLLSISQFTRDNNVVIEFHSDSCFVKDKHNHKILLKGTLSKGLYQLDLSSILLSRNASISSDSDASSSPCNITTSTSSKPVCSTDISKSNEIKSSNYLHSAFVTNMCKLSADDLHHMFGHPSLSVLSCLCATLKIPLSAKQLSFC